MLNQNRNEIRSYAYDLVERNKICYHHLDDEEKSVMTGLIIKNLKQIGAWEFISEADKNGDLPYMLADYMTDKKVFYYNPNKSNSIKASILIEFMSKNAQKYASKMIDDILDDMNKEFQANKKFYYEI